MYSFDLASLGPKVDPRYDVAPYDPNPSPENLGGKISDASFAIREDVGVASDEDRSPTGDITKSLPGGLKLGTASLVKYRDNVRAILPPAESPERTIFWGLNPRSIRY